MNVIFSGQQFHKITHVTEHFHDSYEIIIITEGDGFIYIDNVEYYVQKESVVVIPPRTLHRNFSASGFTDLFIQVERIRGIQDAPFVYLDKTGIISYLGKTLYATWVQKDYNYQAITSALLTTITEYIIKFKGKGYKYDFVQELKEIIANQFFDCEFDLADEISKLSVSKDYLRCCFREEIGVTPLEYLTNLRIQQAKYYLAQNRHMTIEQVSLNCGFRDQYYFSRCFKKQTGISPREFRKLYNSF